MFDALLGSLGHQCRRRLDFVAGVRSAGVALSASVSAGSCVGELVDGPARCSLLAHLVGLDLGGNAFAMPLIDWINEGLLTFFFLVVGLEIKREFTVGRLATCAQRRSRSRRPFAGMPVPR